MSALNAQASGGPASTLAEIEARMKAVKTGPFDVQSLPRVFHEASGLYFRVGPMSRKPHKAWHDLKYIEDRNHKESGAEESGAPIVREQSDVYLLSHAVWTEDGSLLSPEVADWLFNGEGFGPSTLALIQAATAKNPPRGILVNEIQQMWGADQTHFLFMRVLKEAGLFNLIIDRLAGNMDEQAFASRELEKLEQSLEFWEAVYSCDELARDAGFETYEHFGIKPDLENVGD